MIHLLDRNEKIINVLANPSESKGYWDTKMTEDIDNSLLTFDFTTFGDIDFDKVIKITAQDQDGNHRLFIISDINKTHDDNGLVQTIEADGDHVFLGKDKPLRPQTLTGATLETAAEFCLQGTNYQLGQVDYLGAQDVVIKEYLSPLAFLQQLKDQFKCQLRFRVDIVGNTVVRYVDLLAPTDAFSGKEIEFGKDIVGLTRKEDRSSIVTRMIGEAFDADGNLVTFESINDGKDYVSSPEAFDRWAINGQHIYGVHQYQPDDGGDIDKQKMMDATYAALENTNDAVVSYELTNAALEQITGYEHERVRVYMNVRIKDVYFNPALYLTAQVQHTEMPELHDKSNDFVYQFGNYKVVKVTTSKQIKDLQSQLFRHSNVWTSAKPTAVAAQQTANTANQTANTAADTANQAYTQATNAAQMADDALTASNGKNTNYYGPDPPDAPIPGDNWFVEDDNGTITAIKHWDGTQWVVDVDNTSINNAIAQAQQDVTNALNQANSAFDTANQLSQDVTTAVNKAQDAFDAADALSQTVDQNTGDISTLKQTAQGLQSDVRDNANNISSVTQLATGLQSRMTSAEGDINTLTQTADSLTSTITNLQIGGRNYQVNSAFQDGTTNGYSISASATVNLSGFNPVGAQYELRVDASKGNYVYQDLNKSNVFAGKNMIWSFYYSAGSLTGTFQAYIRITDSSGNYTYIDSNKDRGRSGWQRIIIPLDLTGYSESDISEIRLTLNFEHSTGGTIYLTAFKFEEGTKPTDWSPAPEDMATASQISQLADDINLRVVQKNDVINQLNISTEGILIAGNRVHITGQTTIDNAVIKDAMIDSVSANKISATSLSAISANLGNITAGTIRGAEIYANGPLGQVEITDAGWLVRDANNNVRMGVTTESVDWADDNPSGINFLSTNGTWLGWIGTQQNAQDSGVTASLQMQGYKSITISAPSIDIGSASSLNIDGSLIANSYMYSDALDSNPNSAGIHIYIRPKSGGELRATTTGSTSDYADIRGAFFYGNAFDINTGTHVYMRPTSSGEVRATATGSTSTYRPVRASSFPTSSLADYKTHIKPWTDSVWDIVKSMELYEYQLKDDVADGVDFVRHGFVIGDGYNTPEMVMTPDGEAVEQYLMNSLSLKVGQELIVRDELKEQRIQVLEEQSQNIIVKQADHEDRISELEQELVEAKQRISQLEAA
ncbi:hypothetical protein GCM10011391_27960 [Pullulanibacillus camelliae]|uniref:Peptidase S74 domain-containing protein n=1 Tax=Pullulanibacillus camelliae TaxID=1707096 RepID=A0A8J2YJ82_9BACL|nr:phage tail spike protein [Pullulanibacillus camelliae]GGE47553.1 hypothetical protein GCM10011391_27960 [Pullulanibacillus camelliae]